MGVDTDFSSLPGFIQQIDRIDFLYSLDVLPVAFNAVFTLSRLSYYGQLFEQLSVAPHSCPYFLQFNPLLLLYFGQINDDNDDDEIKKKLPFSFLS